jgi:heme-degrading monooxygenase HmoA
MVITVLEGRVPPKNVNVLREAYRTMGINKLPPAIEETFLAQDTSETDVWRIMTVWRSREELEAYRKSVETPGGVLIFRQAGVEPTLRVYEVKERGTH